MGLVTNKDLCQVVCGIVTMNFMHKYPCIVREIMRRVKFQVHSFFCSVDSEGSGKINLPALRCTELIFKCTSPQPPHTTDV